MWHNSVNCTVLRSCFIASIVSYVFFFSSMLFLALYKYHSVLEMQFKHALQGLG